MRIEWSLDTAADPALLTLLQTVGDAALVAEGIHQPCAVHVQLCDEETIRQINRTGAAWTDPPTCSPFRSLNTRPEKQLAAALPRFAPAMTTA